MMGQKQRKTPKVERERECTELPQKTDGKEKEIERDVRNDDYTVLLMARIERLFYSITHFT